MSVQVQSSTRRRPLADGCGVTYLLHRLLFGEKGAAASPAASDRLQVRAGVITEEMQHEVLRDAEDQRTVLPLTGRARIRRKEAIGSSLTFVLEIGPHPAAEVLYQVELHSLDGAVVAAGVKLEETNAQFSTSPFARGTSEHEDRVRTTLLCTAIHNTMSLWPPYTCRRSCD